MDDPQRGVSKGGPQPAFDTTGTSVDSLTSVFAELSTYRSSSWVFEMHQLKNVNRRLKDEIGRCAASRATTLAVRRAACADERRATLESAESDVGRGGWTGGTAHTWSDVVQQRSGVCGAAHPDAEPDQAASGPRPRPRQHLRPSATLAYLHAGSSTDRGSSSSSGSEISPFGERAPNERRRARAMRRTRRRPRRRLRATRRRRTAPTTAAARAAGARADAIRARPRRSRSFSLALDSLGTGHHRADLTMESPS